MFYDELVRWLFVLRRWYFHAIATRHRQQRQFVFRLLTTISHERLEQFW